MVWSTQRSAIFTSSAKDAFLEEAELLGYSFRRTIAHGDAQRHSMHTEFFECHL